MFVNGWMNNQNAVHIYTMKCHSPWERNIILTYATTWMKLVDIMLSEISQSSQGQMVCDFTYTRYPE